MIGTTIGQYRVVDKLGEGGMGEVYRAVDTMLEREVALKVLHRFATQDASRLERFRSEAVTLARLNHPNIAILHNFFEVGQDYYMVMEYVEGENFENLMQRGQKLPLRTTLEWFCQSLKGFEHAHARGVIHRDIKPANLMLNGDGLVKITDFGIARVLGGARLTQTGKLIGTLEYMSPEQVRGEEQDARSDIYSLGILLHELSTGQVPFSGASDYEIMHAHLENVPRPAREFDGSLPAEIETAILKALSKNPDERFQNAAGFRAALEPALASLPVTDEKVVLPIKGTREGAAMVAESLMPDTLASGGEYSQSGAGALVTRAADIPDASPATRDATRKPAALPISWITPKLALGVGLAFLAMMIVAALATRRAPQAGSTPNPIVKSVTPPQPDQIIEEDDKNGSGAVPVVTQPKSPQPVITPIPDPKPAPKPTPKPVAKPTPKPAPKPAPKPRTTVKKRSTPKRSITPKRRSTPKRTTPKRRSKPKRSTPKKGGGDGVIGIIKNS